MTEHCNAYHGPSKTPDRVSHQVNPPLDKILQVGLGDSIRILQVYLTFSQLAIRPICSFECVYTNANSSISKISHFVKLPLKYFITIFVDSNSEEECGELEEYDECGTACPDDCENYQDPFRPCIRICVPDCFCKKGYVRAKNGMCILPEECDIYENDF